MEEAVQTEILQVSKHHLTNSAVSLVFRLVGGFFLVESVYVALLIIALLPQLSPYRDVALKFLWLAFTAKFILESLLLFLLVASWAGLNYYLSDDHLIRYKGIRRRDENVYDLSILKTVELHQGWWGRMFNYGDLRLVFSSSGYSETITLNAIYNPKRYQRILSQRLNAGVQNKANEPWAELRTPG